MAKFVSFFAFFFCSFIICDERNAIRFCDELDELVINWQQPTKIIDRQALLIFDKEINLNNQVDIACMPKYDSLSKNSSKKKCFVVSQEYFRGR